MFNEVFETGEPLLTLACFASSYPLRLLDGASYSQSRTCPLKQALQFHALTEVESVALRCADALQQHLMRSEKNTLNGRRSSNCDFYNLACA